MHIIIDNLSAFTKFQQLAAEANVQIGVFVKIDTGYHRAGIVTSSPNFAPLVNAVATSSGGTFLKGFYSHYGHSYAGNSPDDAATGLIDELVGLEAAISSVPSTYTGKLTLSVGATPTATSAQDMLTSSSPRVSEFNAILSRLQANHSVELHAGVYPVLDCQQIATHARSSDSTSGVAVFPPLSKDAIAIKMLLEVSSVYTERVKPEALISAGSLALGREPCKSYPGWGIVTPDLSNSSQIYEESGEKTGWIVGRISQEHGILTWEGDRSTCKEFEVWDKIMVWPNHACVVGAGAGWYLVVDGDEDPEKVVDVWVRWRGW
jgi:D-serine deaminase-like pyridoxal phosphate-dependent protein